MAEKTTKPVIKFSQWQADLVWAMHSPLLTALPKFAPTLPILPAELCADSGQADAANDHQPPIALKSGFLGPYFELLWLHLLKSSNNLQVLAHNLQIHKQGKTHGEFDFILSEKPSDNSHPAAQSCSDGSLAMVIHQELAAKFYLGLPDVNNDEVNSLWFGPNLIDRLDVKLHNMITAQSKLAELPLVRAKLESAKSLRIGRNTRIKPEIVMKGMLFDPCGTKLGRPAYINPQAPAGQWLPVSELTTLAGKQYRWVILPRLSWLSTSSFDHPLLNHQQMTDFCSKSVKRFNSQLIAAVTVNKQQQIMELKKYFIVGDNWAEAARATLKTNPVQDIPYPYFQ